MSPAHRIYAVDPGGTTGHAVVEGGTVRMAGAVPRSDALEVLTAAFVDYRPHLVVLEGWENQGRRPNIHAAYANQVLGYVKALAHVYKVPLVETYASVWKPAMRAGAMAIPGDRYGVPTVRKESRALALRLALELGGWPANAFKGLPRRDWPHVIDAIALAVWGWKYGARRPRA